MVKNENVLMNLYSEPLWGGVDPSGQPDRFIGVFFLITSLIIEVNCLSPNVDKLTELGFIFQRFLQGGEFEDGWS